MRYFYGAADEKHVRLTSDSVLPKKRENPLDSYRFRLDPSLRGKPKINRHETSIRYKVSPDTLVELCSTKVNSLPLPKGFKMTRNDVADYFRKLGYPEYQNTIKKNFIDGHDLITMDASNLIQLNIKKFDHIKIITEAIRSMYRFDKSSFNRSVSLPDRTPEAQYKFYRVRNGPKYEKARRTDLFRSRNLLRPPPLYETHWQRLERWLKHRRPVDVELIGGFRRNKDYMYHAPKDNRPPAPPKKQHICTCMPPCTCYWNERDFRPAANLKCLKRTPQLPAVSSSCKCVGPCTCGWPRYQQQMCMSILMKHMPEKYDKGTLRRSYNRQVGIRRSIRSL